MQKKFPIVFSKRLIKFIALFHKKTQGLTPAAAAVISLAVAVATAGTGAAAGFAGMVGCLEGSTAAAMTSAGFTSLVSQTTVSAINNQGNLTKALKDLKTPEQIRTLAMAVASAGLVHEIGDK